MNGLYYGDNLDILKKHIKNESVDPETQEEVKSGRKIIQSNSPDRYQIKLKLGRFCLFFLKTYT